MKIQTTALGEEIQTGSALAFFGNRHSQLSALQKQYPQFKFVRVIQVHKDNIVHTTIDSKDQEAEADSHWSEASATALCSITADCIPVLIYDAQTSKIAAVHAGWRGVVQRIVPKTIETLMKTGSRIEHLQVFIGPHILFSSFEVGLDVRDQIFASLPVEVQRLKNFVEQGLEKPLSKEKSLVNLHSVLMYQLQEYEIPSDQIMSFLKDTKTDSNYHSARRDAAQSGRQISFIALR